MHEMKRSYFDIQYSIFKAAYGEWKRYPSGFYPLQEQLPFPDRPYFVIISGSQRLSSGINNTITVYISNRPRSMQKIKTHLPIKGTVR